MAYAHRAVVYALFEIYLVIVLIRINSHYVEKMRINLLLFEFYLVIGSKDCSIRAHAPVTKNSTGQYPCVSEIFPIWLSGQQILGLCAGDLSG